MEERTTEIAHALKGARQAAGLSQRALASLVSLPQSHISKIETGAVDAQVSTIVEIARVLGFDLRLIPRPGLAAVDSLVRQFAPADALNSQAGTLTKKLESQTAPFDQVDASMRAQAMDALRLFLSRTRHPHDTKALRHILKRLDRIENAPAARVKLEEALRKLIDLCHRAIPTPTNPTQTAKPAYSLEEDDDA